MSKVKTESNKKYVKPLCIYRDLETIKTTIESIRFKPVTQFLSLDISPNLKAYNFEWEYPYGNTLKDINILNETFSHLQARSSIESKSSRLNFHDLLENQSLISKEHLWKDQSVCSVMFITEEEKTYLYLSGPSASINKTKSTFFRNIKSNPAFFNHIEDAISEYNFDSRFFIWLLDQHGKTFNFSNFNFSIKDINYWDANEERNEGHFSASGPCIHNDRITSLAAVTKDFSKMSILLEIDNLFRINCRLSQDGCVEFDSSKCKELLDANNSKLEDHKIIILIYKFIIPLLKTNYNKFFLEKGQDGIDSIKYKLEDKAFSK